MKRLRGEQVKGKTQTKSFDAARGATFGAARRVLRVARRALRSASYLRPFPLSPAPRAARAQEVVDKMVATINGSELITYTDLLWQLALQPDAALDNPRPEDLQQAS